ncbi:hypothetical protein [Vibrio algarum]|uniref:Uncharacterized protein n=1 Tax=Vibrio algarum TaxID=3020714 RepID=A0ABT4YM03_9VIBR|nr:hypothetical protein [Vibrio sp. KJ40-1]MDB1122569.1 hypothetical protein [Vibrio sp. KJ40-1]
MIMLFADCFFSTKVFAELGDFATGTETVPQRRKDTLLVVRENLTDVGRIKIPNSQAAPLPI